MEHRLFRRFASDHPIDIFRGHRCILHGRARNVSREGVLLEAEDGPLPAQGHVELEINLSESEGPRRVRGVVVYRDDRKFGVMILDPWSQSEWHRLTGPIAAGAHPTRSHNGSLDRGEVDR